MNILFDINVVCPYPGNLLSSLWKLADQLENLGSFVFYLFPSEAKEIDWVEGFAQKEKVYFKENGIISKFKLYQTIVLENKIDIIYSHFWTLDDSLIMKLLKTKNKKLKYVIHHHNEYHISDRWLNERIKHWILDADMHISCGKYVTDQVKKAGYRNVFWIENCIDFSRLDAYEIVDFGLESKCMKLLLFSSYSYEIKGVDIAIKGIKKARENHVDSALILSVGANMDEIINRVKADCGGSIPFWVKIIPAREDVATLYRSVDAYLNASRSEGFCYSSVEAAYCGTQVVQSDIPQNRLDIPETYIFESENENDLCDKLLKFAEDIKCGDSDKRKIMHNYVVNEYSLDKWIESEINALNRLQAME